MFSLLFFSELLDNVKKPTNPNESESKLYTDSSWEQNILHRSFYVFFVVVVNFKTFNDFPLIEYIFACALDN